MFRFRAGRLACGSDAAIADSLSPPAGPRLYLSKHPRGGILTPSYRPGPCASCASSIARVTVSASPIVCSNFTNDDEVDGRDYSLTGITSSGPSCTQRALLEALSATRQRSNGWRPSDVFRFGVRTRHHASNGTWRCGRRPAGPSWRRPNGPPAGAIRCAVAHIAMHSLSLQLYSESDALPMDLQ